MSAIIDSVEILSAESKKHGSSAKKASENMETIAEKKDVIFSKTGPLGASLKKSSATNKASGNH